MRLAERKSLPPNRQKWFLLCLWEKRSMLEKLHAVSFRAGDLDFRCKIVTKKIVEESLQSWLYWHLLNSWPSSSDSAYSCCEDAERLYMPLLPPPPPNHFHMKSHTFHVIFWEWGELPIHQFSGGKALLLYAVISHTIEWTLIFPSLSQ